MILKQIPAQRACGFVAGIEPFVLKKETIF